MVHIYSTRNILETLLYSLLTYFIVPYILVEKTKFISMKHFDDPCQMAFIIGFTISIILWNIYTKKNVYH